MQTLILWSFILIVYFYVIYVKENLIVVCIKIANIKLEYFIIVNQTFHCFLLTDYQLFMLRDNNYLSTDITGSAILNIRLIIVKYAPPRVSTITIKMAYACLNIIKGKLIFKSCHLHKSLNHPPFIDYRKFQAIHHERVFPRYFQSVSTSKLQR